MEGTIFYNGLGRIGSLPNKVSLADYGNTVKSLLNVPFVRVVGPLDKPIQKVAVLGGDGNKYISIAKRAGADVLVTGDLYFHVAQDALAMNLAVIDPGHHIEQIMKTGVAKYMEALCIDKKIDCNFIDSKISTEPFQLL